MNDAYEELAARINQLWDLISRPIVAAMSKRWRLIIRNVHGDLVHDERFWFRRNAVTVGEFYASPLPVRTTSVTGHGHRREGELLRPLKYEVVRRPR